MLSTPINLDFVPLFFFFILYSFLEILITRTMENYRLIEIEEEFENEEEEFEDYDAGEFEENLIPQGVILPVNLNLIEEVDDDSDYDDDDEDEDYEEDDDYEDEVEEYYEEEEAEELIPVETTLPRVSSSMADGRNLNGAVEINGVSLDNLNDSESNAELNTRENDGLFCPICFEAWTSGGEHQICCLPCGHIYGLSCIKKWLQQSQNSGKCPQCNNLCTLKDIRVLYVSRLCVADEELHKRVLSLEAKCSYLEHKAARLKPEELIDQICSNPNLVQQLAKTLAELHQQQVIP